MSAAEREALDTSDLLRSYRAGEEAAGRQADAEFQNLLPKLSFQGSFQYYAQVPNISFPIFGNVPFGTNSVYSIGPQINYTLWDTFSARDAFRSAEFMEKARSEDRKNARLQLMASVRNAYVQVQLGIEELKLINDSLNLARAQDRDVMSRFRAGAADRLDVVTSQRSVLSYRIQFEQRQAELSAAFKDLLNLIGDHALRDVSHPGPPDVPGVTLVLKLNSLRDLLATGIVLPSGLSLGSEQPQIRSQELQASSYEFGAKSDSAKLFPVVQMSGGVSEIRPDIPNPPTFLQETVGVTLSLPLYLGDSSHDLAESQRMQSESAQFRADQLKQDLSRDFSKAREMLNSLRVQSELAERDVNESEQEAKLYFTSYKAGKINFIDVENADVQAFQAKVSAARIDAQILGQIITLLSLSSGDAQDGR